MTLLNRFTDPPKQTVIPPTGRTKWDVLSGPFKWAVLGFVIIIVIIILYAIPATSQTISDIVSEYGPYVVPFVLGLVFGYWVYFQFIRDYVIIQVEDINHNLQLEYEISRIRFKKMTIKNGAVNPQSTGDGHQLYRCRDYNKETDEIDLGYCHRTDTEYAVIMTIKDKFDALIQHDHEMTVRVVFLEKLSYHESVEFGHEMAGGCLDALGMPNPYVKDNKTETKADDKIHEDVHVTNGGPADVV